MKFTRATLNNGKSVVIATEGALTGHLAEDYVAKLITRDIRNTLDAPIAPNGESRFAIRLKFVDFAQVTVTAEELDEVIADAKAVLADHHG